MPRLKSSASDWRYSAYCSIDSATGRTSTTSSCSSTPAVVVLRTNAQAQVLSFRLEVLRILFYRQRHRTYIHHQLLSHRCHPVRQLCSTNLPKSVSKAMQHPTQDDWIRQGQVQLDRSAHQPPPTSKPCQKISGPTSHLRLRQLSQDAHSF